MADQSNNQQHQTHTQDSEDSEDDWLDPALRATRKRAAGRPAAGGSANANGWGEDSAQAAIQRQRSQPSGQTPQGSGQTTHAQADPILQPATYGFTGPAPVYPPATYGFTGPVPVFPPAAYGFTGPAPVFPPATYGSAGPAPVFPPATHASTGPAPGQRLTNWMFSLPPYNPAIPRAWTEQYTPNPSADAVRQARGRSTWPRIEARCENTEEAVHWSDKIEAEI